MFGRIYSELCFSSVVIMVLLLLWFLLEWNVRYWSSVAYIFSSLVMSWASSCVHSSQSLLKVINFFLAHIPWIDESHDLGRPFKVVMTISPFAFSSTASSCSLIWATLWSRIAWSLSFVSSHSLASSLMSSSGWCSFLRTTWSKHRTLRSMSSMKTHGGWDDL